MLQDAPEIQQKYKEKHSDGKCMQCPMSPQFGGDEFCSILIQYGKLSIVQRPFRENID